MISSRRVLYLYLEGSPPFPSAPVDDITSCLVHHLDGGQRGLRAIWWSWKTTSNLVFTRRYRSLIGGVFIIMDHDTTYTLFYSVNLRQVGITTRKIRTTSFDRKGFTWNSKKSHSRATTQQLLSPKHKTFPRISYFVWASADSLAS